MAWRPHSRARVNTRAPQAWAVCDRCGFVHNHVNLRWQMQYRGAGLANTRLLVCDACHDKPQPQLRVKILPPDPVPIRDPRPQPAQPPQPYAWSLAGLTGRVYLWSGNGTGPGDGLPSMEVVHYPFHQGVLSAATGSYGVTGYAATLVKTLGRQTFQLSGDVGSYFGNINPGAMIKAAGAPTFATGAYAFGGQSASFALARNFSASTGNFVMGPLLSSDGVIFDWNPHARGLSAFTGHLNIAGEDGILLHKPYILGDVGAYAITAAATLRKGRTLSLATGSFTLAGTATMLRQAKLARLAGSYTLQGSTATLAKNKINFFVPIGNYNAFVNPATMTYYDAGNRVTQETTSLLLTEGGVSMRTESGVTAYTLAAATGGYSATLQLPTADIHRANVTMDALEGSFIQHGGAGSFSFAKPFTLSASTGPYAITGSDASLARLGKDSVFFPARFAPVDIPDALVQFSQAKLSIGLKAMDAATIAVSMSGSATLTPVNRAPLQVNGRKDYSKYWKPPDPVGGV